MPVGTAITLGQFSGEPLGASWGDDDTITFATTATRAGLWQVSADGGEPTILRKADTAQYEDTYSFPSVLPLGRGVLFTIATPGAGSSVAVLDLKTGQRKTLIPGGSDAQYVETGPRDLRSGWRVASCALRPCPARGARRSGDGR